MRTVGLRIDPTVPVHQQPTFVVHRGRAPGCRHFHAWFSYANGVHCSDRYGNHGCGELRIRLDGRRRYRGRHRR
ncbi:hypothetical protein SEA_KNOCKER_92 [Mycobacterium phage Knocker]|nr:hypothetical protein SEA_KNOCKER_92 [Mycobacterium phage Knocker]